ncbi:unnamed protein product [Lymnaea stagnalis]|uniref:NR LBD domain-containing protein n=1 Tax=Lymnaea stagnalis TaxID=6523 RepID=A0AAV2HHK2_LYMST
MAELQRLLHTEVFTFEPLKALLSGVEPSTSSTTTVGNLNGNTGTQPVNANVAQPLLNLNRSSPGFNANLNTTNLNTTATITIDNQGHANLNTNVSATVTRGPTKQEIDLNQARPSPQQATADSNANLTDVAHLLDVVHEAPSDGQKDLINQVTDTVVDAHLATTVNTQANILEANERIDKEKDAPEQLDNASPSVLWQQFTSAMLPELTKVVNFTKKLPGFSELNAEDQVQLIKQGSFEVMVARISLLIDEINQEMLDPQLKLKCSRNIVREMPMGPLIDQMFEVAEQLNPMRLTDGEIGLFTAALIITPERSGLKNTTAVRTIHRLFLQALYCSLKQTHADADHTFRSLLSLLPLLKNINESHTRFLNNIKAKSPAMFSSQFPQLHKEVFDN